jgi:RNA polymerase sigma-70 factor (ECF subfamily)
VYYSAREKTCAIFFGFFLSFSVLCLVLAFSDSAAVGRTWVSRPETIPMTQDHPSTTDVTLLSRLHHDPRDQSTWSDFVARYGPKILRWCRRWVLQEADAQDVTQDVLLKLNARMASFAYDALGSFRAWLMTLAHHVWRDLADGRRRAGIGAGDSRIGAFLESLEVGDDLVEELQEEFRRELRDRALDLARPSRSPRHAEGRARWPA